MLYNFLLAFRIDIKTEFKNIFFRSEDIASERAYDNLRNSGEISLEDFVLKNL